MIRINLQYILFYVCSPSIHSVQSSVTETVLILRQHHYLLLDGSTLKTANILFKFSKLYQIYLTLCVFYAPVSLCLSTYIYTCCFNRSGENKYLLHIKIFHTTPKHLTISHWILHFFKYYFTFSSKRKT